MNFATCWQSLVIKLIIMEKKFEKHFEYCEFLMPCVLFWPAPSAHWLALQYRIDTRAAWTKLVIEHSVIYVIPEYFWTVWKKYAAL